jgi:hypothetical protein
VVPCNHHGIVVTGVYEEGTWGFTTSHFLWENKGKSARTIWETMGNPIEMEVFMVPSGKRLQKTMEHHHV